MDECYEQLQALHLDLSAFGFASGDDSCAYFCTPKGAAILGCAGVDGIHYCTVPDFGSVIFAVNPMDFGDYIHPIARNFEDLLRLLLSGTDMAALEQCHAWTREQFSDFLAEYPPTPEQKQMLQVIAEQFQLEPMDDPYAYVHSLQDELDLSGIAVLEDEDEEVSPVAFEEASAWSVSFNGGFGTGSDDIGFEKKIDVDFFWGGQTWHVPAMYLCEQGLVVDICMVAEPDAVRAAMEKDSEGAFSENPLALDFRGHISWNGQKLPAAHACSMVYWPAAYFPEEAGQEADVLRFMEHYQLNPEHVWLLHRAAYRWKGADASESLSCTLRMEQRSQRVLGKPFSTPSVGESVSVCHPVSNQVYTLTVQELSWQTLCDGVSNVLLMQYSLSPENGKPPFSLVDATPGDEPMHGAGSDGPGAATIGIIGGADGPTAVVLSGAPSAFHAACSGVRREAVDTAQWQPVFRIKALPDCTVSLI